MLTLATELPGGIDSVRLLTDLGVIAAIGHTDATYEQTREAIEAGATVATHLFNAMPPLGHRAPGPVAALLEDPRVTVELINDGTHLHPAALELAFRLAGAERVAFITDAMDAAGIGDYAAYGQRAGVYYSNINGGTAAIMGWFDDLLLKGKQASRPFTAMAIMGNAGGAQVAIRQQVRGPVLSYNSACASSGVAIGEAARAIADGYIDVALAGGAEAPLTAGVLGIFEGSRAMSSPDAEDPARTCKPFSATRSGLVLGEGSAWLVLESEDAARARGATIHAYLSGYGVSCDAHHIGMPESGGQVRALQAALDSAGLAPAEIGYINAHATATHGGDMIESAAIRQVFGAGPDAPRVSSTKAVHGHLIGATSALELALTVLAMQDALLPASAHIGEPDPRCELHHVGPAPVAGAPYRHALSFSCGFGGTNAALIVSLPAVPPS